jgi:hypothetical protein
MKDDVIYHLLVPKAIVAHRSYISDPYNINTNLPMLFEMPLVVFEMYKNILSPFLINLFFLIMVILVYVFKAQYLYKINSKLLILVIPVLIYTPLFYDLSHSCYVEIFFTLLIIFAFYHYFIFLEKSNRFNHWYMSMLFFAFAGSTKYFGPLYFLFVACLEFFRTPNRKQYWTGIGIFLICVSPWYVKNFITLSNPMYPLLSDLFESSFLSSNRAERFIHLSKSYNAIASSADWFLFPIRLIFGIEYPKQPGHFGFGGNLSPFFLLSFIGLGIRNRRNTIISVLFLGYFIFWLFSSQQTRFLLPVLLLSSLEGLQVLDKKLTNKKLIISLVCIFIVLYNLFSIYKSMKRDNIDSLLLQKITKEQFIKSSMPVSYGIAMVLNKSHGREITKLLTIGNYGRNYYFTPPVITNTYWDTEYFDKAFLTDNINTDILIDFFNRCGISHILFNNAYFQQYHFKNPHFDMKAWNKFCSTHFKVVAEYQDVVLLSFEK